MFLYYESIEGGMFWMSIFPTYEKNFPSWNGYMISTWTSSFIRLFSKNQYYNHKCKEWLYVLEILLIGMESFGKVQASMNDVSYELKLIVDESRAKGYNFSCAWLWPRGLDLWPRCSACYLRTKWESFKNRSSKFVDRESKIISERGWCQTNFRKF